MTRIELDHAAIARLLAGDEVTDELEDRAEPIERQARRLVAVETGRLRDSIETEVVTDNDGTRVVVVKTDVEYALVQELRAPYLRPALDAGRQ